MFRTLTKPSPFPSLCFEVVKERASISKMANKVVKNLFFHIQIRFLNISATTKLSSTINSSSPSSNTVQFLVKSCGVPLESALSISKTFQLDEKNLQKHQSVINFLKSQNFNDTQLAKLISKKPKILQCRVENNLLPKFNYLTEIGFVGHLLPQLIMANPEIIRRGLNTFKPFFVFLKSILKSNEQIIAAIKRCSLLLFFDLEGNMKPNIDLLVKEGVSANLIEKLVASQPRTITQRHERMVCAVNAVKNLGIEATDRKFLVAVRMMISFSEVNWKKKIELFKSGCGWSEEEILSTFKKEPNFLGCSEKKFKNAMDFFLNTVKLEPQIILANPRFLMHSIDKRLRPRYNVLKVLEAKKLIERSRKVEWALLISEKEFQKNFVSKYAAEVPGLLEMYLGATHNKKIDTL